jgi:hypothetical protein
MAEEITNNPAPLTARQVAAQNPELNKLREIAFGTNYLDDIDAGTGTARFYSGFGQQPNYMGTNTDQAIADAVTAQAETVAAPDQSSGNGQETSGGITGVSGLPDNSMYGGDLDQGGAGDGITNYENTPDETIQQQEDINKTITGLGNQYDIYDPSVDSSMYGGDLNQGGDGITNYENTPQETAEQTQAIENAITGLGDQYDIYNPIETGSAGDVMGEAALPEDYPTVEQKSMTAPYGIGTDFNQPIDYEVIDSQTADELGGLTQEQIEETGIIDKVMNTLEDPISREQVTNAIQAGRIGLAAITGGGSEVINTIGKIISGNIAGKTISSSVSPVLTDAIEEQEQTNIMDLGDQQFAETGDYDVYSGGDTGTTSSPTPAADYSYEGSDEQDEASNYDSTPSPAPSQPDQRDRGGDGGGGGGGSSKIVCTMMNDTYGFGNFRNKIWLRQSKDLAPEYQKGYHKIFLPLVKLSKTNVVIRKILEHIAVHRTIDIRQEARGEVHILGRIYRKILEPICYLVGKYVK